MKVIPKKVGNVAVRPGKWSRGTLTVADYLDGRPATIPLWIAAGPDARPGKKGMVGGLVGGAHGNEPNGPELVHRVMSDIDPKELHGVLIVLPLMNPWGFIKRTRLVPIDQRDLNRSYPGHPSGPFSLRVAHTILTDVVAHCQFVIDAHDAGDRIVLVPHVRVHDEPEHDPSQTLGIAFGSDVVFLRLAERGMLAGEARQAFGTTVVSVEVGGAMYIWEHAQEYARRGVFNMLRAQGMLKGSLIVPPHQHLLRTRHDIPAELSGIQTNLVELGQVVQKGMPLYRITDPVTGKVAIHRADRCGVMLALNHIASVEKAAPTAAILEFDSCDAEALLKSNVIKNKSDQATIVMKSTQNWSHIKH